MVIQIIILAAIPIFLGIVAVSPFDQPEEFNDEIILVEEPGMNILYSLLIGIWIIILLRMLLQIKKDTLKATKKY